MINIASEMFVEELTVPCVVPRAWVDEFFFSDEAILEDEVELRGMFRVSVVERNLGLSGVFNTVPVLWVETEKVPNPREDDIVIVDGVRYRIGEPKPGSNGITVLELVLDHD